MAAEPTPAQGNFSSTIVGMTGGYTGDSLSLKIIIAFLIGLGVYNAIEVIIICFVTFNRYSGLYFWSVIIASFGIIPYQLGFLIKFFQLLNPNADIGYVAVVLLSIGWYMSITGQSVVLWSRLHLLTNSRRTLRYTRWMIISNVFLLHFPTTVLTFGANANNFSDRTLSHFVHGYNLMEKIQMTGFFIQETILSAIYIRETLRLLKLSQTVHEQVANVTHDGGVPRHGHIKCTMYQLLAINAIIIVMDIAVLAIIMANLYLIETVLKGVVYSIKLKLEFAVLGKLTVVARHGTGSDMLSSSLSARYSPPTSGDTSGSGAVDTEKICPNGALWAGSGCSHGRNSSSGFTWPSFVDPKYVQGDFTRAPSPVRRIDSGDWDGGVGEGEGDEEERKRRRLKVRRARRESWIDEEMNKHNIG
ncbi:hypothetical protein CC80DRAFT_455365 [Byssothecium circinans]|uniref:DUF7703 domain-containing protein n=1 Tax=Byssothecium circinans TaxID=147558 RepID=A0A6A5TDK5_9PLEO|nr:hypothetical protein CC80DRAFT_455365 [Byssothecium circinans]